MDANKIFWLACFTVGISVYFFVCTKPKNQVYVGNNDLAGLVPALLGVAGAIAVVVIIVGVAFLAGADKYGIIIPFIH